jgi:hypothetical protein
MERVNLFYGPSNCVSPFTSRIKRMQLQLSFCSLLSFSENHRIQTWQLVRSFRIVYKRVILLQERFDSPVQ